MTEVTQRPSSSFPRPASLYMPDVMDSTPSLLRSSSYSPFPTFPGSKIDPLDLDRFLLHPDDPSWSYRLPLPAESTSPENSTQAAGNRDSMTTKGLKKVRSFSMLSRPSPLSQPPVGAEGEDLEIRQRTRSNSVDSISSVSDGKPADLEYDVKAMIEPKKETLGKKTMRQAFQFRRKSALSSVDSSDDLREPTSSLTRTGPSTSSLTSDESDPSTPSSSQSTTHKSDRSSASSSSSSEGVKTPNEVGFQPLDMEIAGGKLAVALAAATDKGNRKSNWRGWLGGKRASKALSAPGSGASTPPEVSAESSPNASSVVLNTVPQLTLTPSLGTAISRSVSLSSADRAVNRGLTIEQLRRVSVRKLTQLRSPSPHPLALALRRQYSNLPDEIASSIQSGQKVFPLSVNAYDPKSELSPSPRGLLTSLGVKHVLTQLEKGNGPDLPMNVRRSSDPTIVRRPKGVLDFINRHPYEERNLVFFANGTCSPISMARPGYGVWDLDFSPYIIALSAIDKMPSAPWPTLPRASIGPMDVMEQDLAVTEEPIPSPDSEVEEILVSPSPVVADLAEVEEEPVSSFRNAKPATSRASKVWTESSDEEEDDDDSPLASFVTKRNKSSTTLTRSAAPEVVKHERSKSTPTTKRVSIVVDKEAAQRRIMDEVAKARERRHANLTGEVERLAEAERIKRQPPTAYKRSSTMDIAHHRTSSASASAPALNKSAAPNSPTREARPRAKSSYDVKELSRPENMRAPSAPGGLPSKRYHSFYDLPKAVQPSSPQRPQLAHLPSQTFVPQPYPVYAHPVMPSYPSVPSFHGMVFPAAGYVQPMMQPSPMMPQQPIMAYGQQQASPMYLQMQSRPSRSSLSVPEAHSSSPRRPRLSRPESSSRSPRSSYIA